MKFLLKKCDLGARKWRVVLRGLGLIVSPLNGKPLIPVKHNSNFPVI